MSDTRGVRVWFKAFASSAIVLLLGLVGLEFYFRQADTAQGEASIGSGDYPTTVQYLAEASRYFKAMTWVGGDLVHHHRPRLDEEFQHVRVRTNADGWRTPDVGAERLGIVRTSVTAVGDASFASCCGPESSVPVLLSNSLASAFLHASRTRVFSVHMPF
mgnify:CR=1 FL=1